MQKGLYSPDFIVSYSGCVMRFGAIREWVEMDEIDYADIRPATYDEIVHYSEVQKREK